MVETVVPGGPAEEDAERVPGTVPQAAERPIDPGALAAKARFERELAVLDLADAAQAASRSASTVESAPDGHSQAEVAAQLYASADEHRRTAERLELQAAPPATEDE